MFVQKSGNERMEVVSYPDTKVRTTKTKGEIRVRTTKTKWEVRLRSLGLGLIKDEVRPFLVFRWDETFFFLGEVRPLIFLFFRWNEVFYQLPCRWLDWYNKSQEYKLFKQEYAFTFEELCNISSKFNLFDFTEYWFPRRFKSFNSFKEIRLNED